MYIVAPPPPKKKALDANAQAIASESLMDDLGFGAESGHMAYDAPNSIIVRYFETMLPLWAGTKTVAVTAKEIASTLNNDDAGVY